MSPRRFASIAWTLTLDFLTLGLWRLALPMRRYLVAVPIGYDQAEDGKAGEDPRFLRQMAESMRACPVVYENMNSMLKERQRTLMRPPPVDSQASRDSDEWKKKQASIEADLLRFLLLGPINSVAALNALEKRRKEIDTQEFSNWALERTEK